MGPGFFQLYRSQSSGVDAYFLAIFAQTFELDLTFDQGKERVVFAATDVVTRMNGRATLADQNRTGGNFLAIETFDSEAFACTITAVSGTADTFFMSHDLLLKLQYLLS